MNEVCILEVVYFSHKNLSISYTYLFFNSIHHRTLISIIVKNVCIANLELNACFFQPASHHQKKSQKPIPAAIPSSRSICNRIDKINSIEGEEKRLKTPTKTKSKINGIAAGTSKNPTSEDVGTKSTVFAVLQRS